ncbi:hypothetical protein Ais01nite_12710 [Asanoa ishikariensis]|uniref:Uncharacterized protein n=2 Tax=Asanoa ishikariensis TaxID=137265 RepID=A0A1H3T1D3_9ACTN|nr:hypothetical protein Ais01nite_12710 [Asanoa ishikariensis]SDZ43139.1 hypothetical protein SAMN05421684_4956 [Asanoa ishikariensis]
MVALAVLLVVYAGFTCLPIARAAAGIDNAAEAAATASAQGQPATRPALDSMPVRCDGLAVETDTSNFHRGGTVTSSVGCTLRTPGWLGWFGVDDHVVLRSSASSIISVDRPYTFVG